MELLCLACAQTKQQREARDFTLDSNDQAKQCRFCRYTPHSGVAEYCSVWAHADRYPVSDGHHLVLPKRHTSNFFTMTEQERYDANILIRYLRNKLCAEDSTIQGFNIGMNCGREAGQSIFHAHWHVIPRRVGDSKAKKGGVRAVIPEKADY